jgi:hypothetical protein
MQDNSKKQLSASEAGDDLIHGDEAEKLSKSEKPNNGSGRCTLEILILLGYGADAPKKDFTPILKFNFSEKATRIWSYLLLDLMFTN